MLKQDEDLAPGVHLGQLQKRVCEACKAEASPTVAVLIWHGGHQLCWGCLEKFEAEFNPTKALEGWLANGGKAA